MNCRREARSYFHFDYQVRYCCHCLAHLRQAISRLIVARKTQDLEINMAITTSSKSALVEVQSMTNETRLGIESFKFVL